MPKSDEFSVVRSVLSVISVFAIVGLMMLIVEQIFHWIEPRMAGCDYWLNEGRNAPLQDESYNEFVSDQEARNKCLQRKKYGSL